MKIKTSQISIRKIGLIVPVLAYFLIYGIFSTVSALTMRVYSHQSFASIAYTIPYINMISLICAYLCCHLYTKKKRWGYLGFTFSFVLVNVFYYLRSDKDYGSMSWADSYFLYSSVTGILLYILYDWYQKKQKDRKSVV